MTSSSIDISRLAPEILLSIFSKLDSNQATVVMRRVCRDWLQVIDNNQLLWRVFDWTQEDQEDFTPALEMFDEKSRSTLEEVSIQKRRRGGESALHLMKVLNQSRSTLKQVTLHRCGLPLDPRSLDQLPELLSSSSKLRRFILWNKELPVSRLVPSNRNIGANSDLSSTSGLELLWVSGYTKNLWKLDNKGLKSLSFSPARLEDAEVSRPLVTNFSETIIHLKMDINSTHVGTMGPIICPRLRVLEGWVDMGVSSFLDAANLEIFVMEDVRMPWSGEFGSHPSSLEEIWLSSRGEDVFEIFWEPLLQSCPKLKILKLTEAFISPDDPFEHKLDVLGFLKFLEERKTRAQDGEVTDGIRMIPIQKLILPTHLLSQDELIRARDAVEEVVDVKDYREIIEIEY